MNVQERSHTVMLDIIIILVVGLFSYVFGVFAFSQIIGGIRTKSHLFAIIFWLVLLAITVLLVLSFLKSYIVAYVLGIVVSFFQVSMVKNIQ